MPHKLLLADDSVTIQRVIELTFADEDVQVIAVGDGKQAIERIEAERPDIVLADVGMPERDGYDVAEFVKTSPHLAHIPVLLLTGAFEPVDEGRASAVGCDGVLAKPFEPQMVITRVKELLAGVPPSVAGGPVGPREAGGTAGAEDRGAAPAAPADAGDTIQAEAPLAPPPGLPPEGPARTDDPLAAAKLRLSRRTPIAVPGFGAPVSPAASTTDLDEYFDQLDAAFTSLQAPGQTAAADVPPAPVREHAAADSAAAAGPEPERAAPPGAAAPAPVAETPAETPAAAASGAPSAAAPVAAPPPAPGISQAFSALFAAERGETPEAAPLFIGPGTLPPAVMEDLADRVTRQVLERMSDRLVRETVQDAVSRVAERLVRDEIERVKATLK
ncbi:MAG TPA: response regulator [Vicinamibacterales bacterium]|nr:response regulator [Vicinamibacterales bacterium]HPK71691.1 response regulator [Vicinamibacterales bacterium]